MSEEGKVFLRFNDVRLEGCCVVYLTIPKSNAARLRFDDSFDWHECQLLVIIDRVRSELFDTQLLGSFLLERLNFSVVIPSGDCKLKGLLLLVDFQRHPIASSYGSCDLRLR